MNADWARACSKTTVVFFVAQYLTELGQPPHQTEDNGAKNIYSDAVTKVPDYAQDTILSISALSEKGSELVKTMAALNRGESVTDKHARKYARDVAKVMWKSKRFRKNLASYWNSEQMLRQLELESLDDYESKRGEEGPLNPGQQLALKMRKQRLQEKIDFCERRSDNSGAWSITREKGDASGSDGELASEEEQAAEPKPTSEPSAPAAETAKEEAPKAVYESSSE